MSAHRRRDGLHQTKLPEFIAFCESRGWVREPVKGAYEVLRMRSPARRDPMIVHAKDGAKEHFTTWGESATLLKLWFRARREAQEKADAANA